MRRFAQMRPLDTVFFILESEEKPVFASDIDLMEITGRDNIQEGWKYDFTAATFYNPEPIVEAPEFDPPSAELYDNQAALMLAMCDLYAKINELIDKLNTQGGTTA